LRDLIWHGQSLCDTFCAQASPFSFTAKGGRAISTNATNNSSNASNQFFSNIESRQKTQDSLLCIGLDPDPTRFPATFRNEKQPIFAFNKEIIDATIDLACCYKPQIAHYAARGAESELEQTISYLRDLNVPVILDAKRGDIGSTAVQYAIEAFERYGADAVTANPYLGFDSFEPFLAYKEKGIFLLCRTSNPGGADLQNLILESGKQLFEHVAEKAANEWNINNNIALVTGATRPDELKRIRELTGNMTFLLPGIGSQGGDVEASVKAGKGGGLIVSSSRAVLYASSGTDFAEAAHKVALQTRDEINLHRC
jgi:orotidine-5'-phosphate decarboxylase